MKLSDRHCQIAAAIAPNVTAGFEVGVRLIEIVVEAAARGDEKAIELLSQLGIEVAIKDAEPVVVKRSDGSIAAWIF